MTAVWRGFSLLEIVARFDRETKQVRLDQLSPMLPRTVYQWSRYEDGRWGCTQTSYVGDPYVNGHSTLADMGASLPPDKLLHFVFDPDGDAPEGTSIFRPCYGGWKSRRLYLKLEASGYERGAFGIPYVEVAPTEVAYHLLTYEDDPEPGARVTRASPASTCRWKTPATRRDWSKQAIKLSSSKRMSKIELMALSTVYQIL